MIAEPKLHYKMQKMFRFSIRRVVLAGKTKQVLVFLSLFVSSYSLALSAESLATQPLSAGHVKHYSEFLAELDRRVAATEAIVSQRPDSWIHRENAANAYLKRAHLTGDFKDFYASEELLEGAFSLIDGKGGPSLSRARLNYSLHKLPAVQTDLATAEAALLLDDSTLETIQGIRADVHFYSGRYDLAFEQFVQLETNTPSVRSATRLAHFYAHTGDYETAEDWIDKAANRVSGESPHLRSWLHLQLGILDLSRGRWNEALDHYQAGLKLFPGYWLIEEHIAEIYALQGRYDEAESSYRELIDRTQSPFLMSALADVLRSGSNNAKHEEAEALLDKVNHIYRDVMTRIPELIAGHALEFYLHSGDLALSKTLAHNNYALRPNSESGLRLIQTYMAVGELNKAEALLEEVVRTPYRSAELHATAAVLFRTLGHDKRADQQTILAQGINPAALSDLEWLRSLI